MAKHNAEATPSGQLFCSRCNAPIINCFQCKKVFTDHEAIYCDDGRHVHVNCWENYQKTKGDIYGEH